MNAQIADYLSPEQKYNYIDNRLSPGVELFLPCDFPENPHPKHMILLHKADTPLFFFINSEINDFINQRQHFKDCQVEIKRNPNHTFLDYDSWLNCAEIKNLFSLDEVFNLLFEDLDRIEGDVDSHIRQEICRIMHKKPKTISYVHRKIIRANFGCNS